jgi:hypothetical protein
MVKKAKTWDEIGKAIGSKIDEGCCCETTEKKNWFSKGCSSTSGCGGAIYGLGFLGSLFYFVTTAPDFWAAVFGVVKAILWPAFVTYGVLKFLGM